MSEELKIVSESPEPTLEEAQAFVKGWVECVDLKNGDCMIVNEEGKLNNMQPNLEATDIWIDSYGSTDVIVGPAIVVKKEVRNDW